MTLCCALVGTLLQTCALRDIPYTDPMQCRYDYKTNARKQESIHVQHADVVLFDGILAFHNKGQLICAKQPHLYPCLC